MIVYASTDPDFKNLTSFALVHPSRVENEEAKDINIPGLLLPSSAEPDMVKDIAFNSIVIFHPKKIDSNIQLCLQ